MRLDDPIPPTPARFAADGAPPGVELRLDVYGSWVDKRPTIVPRVAVVHTNGASVEASVQSSVNFGNAGTNNTKPHYLVGDRPAKVLRSDLRAIANATGSTIEDLYGERDASFWTLAIETADMGGTQAVREGIAWPTDCGPFLDRPGDQPDDAEIVARILAYESIVWGFPLVVPDVWNGEGVVAHTEPWPYPHFTIQRGKTCPGATKKRQLFDEILPRAQRIADAWVGTTTPLPEDDDMIAVTDRPYDSDSPKGVYEFGPLDPGVVRKIPIVFGKRAKGTIMVETTAGRRGWVSLTGSPSTSGTSAITHFEPRPGAQIRTPWFDLEFPDGHGYISSHVPLDRIVVDVQWIG